MAINYKAFLDVLRRLFGASAQSQLDKVMIPKLIAWLFTVPQLQALVKKYITKSTAKALKAGSGFVVGPVAVAFEAALRAAMPWVRPGFFEMFHNVLVDFLNQTLTRIETMTDTDAEDPNKIREEAIKAAQEAAKKKVVVVWDNTQFVVHEADCPTLSLIPQDHKEDSTAGVVMDQVLKGKLDVWFHTGPGGCGHQLQGVLVATQPSFPPDTRPSKVSLLNQIAGDRRMLLQRFTRLEKWMYEEGLGEKAEEERSWARKDYDRWVGKPNELAALLELEDVAYGPDPDAREKDLSRCRTLLLRRMREQGVTSAVLHALYKMDDAAETDLKKREAAKQRPGYWTKIFGLAPRKP